MNDTFRYFIRPAKSSEIQQITALAIEALDSDDLFNYNLPYRKEFPDHCRLAWYRTFESWLCIPRTQFLVAEVIQESSDENDDDGDGFTYDSSYQGAKLEPSIAAFAKWDFHYAGKVSSPPGTICDSWSNWFWRACY
ncbi:hypothetical protein AOQ84DRAFT_372311 [Glonium stellatum]|uniref:Uncharacterized protein n=1 Tax=Glonium stellatum TaxID=574774 RepID=A0A8E2FAD8_9PEZI|nr:hypothetical protein AOQ84DRAFT_372311 [Glonium stellatum]